MKFTLLVISLSLHVFSSCMELDTNSNQQKITCMTIISAHNKQLLQMPSLEQSPDIICLQHTGKDDGEIAYFKRKLQDSGYYSVEQTDHHKEVPLINVISYKSPDITFFSFDMSKSPLSVSVSVEKNDRSIRVVSTLPDQDNVLVAHTQDSNEDELVIYASTIEEMTNEQEQDAKSFATNVPSKKVTYQLN